MAPFKNAKASGFFTELTNPMRKLVQGTADRKPCEEIHIILKIMLFITSY